MVWYEAKGFVDTDREEWEFQTLWPAHVPRESSGKPGRGTGRAGDCAEIREQPGATGVSPEGKGKGKEELIKSALIQKLRVNTG